jgi:hypothetical protein
MRIKTFCPSFECWNLDETEAQQLTDHLTATLGNAWTLAPADVINDTLRAWLFRNGQPAEEIPGEGFLPTSITGENGFIEDGEALTLEPEECPPNPLEGFGPAVEFYDNTGQYFEFTDTDGETYTGKIIHGEAFPWIDWDTCPDNWEEAEEFIAQQFNNQPPRHRRRK